MENRRVSPCDVGKNGLEGDETESRQKRLQEGYLKLIDNLRERRARCEKVRPNEEGIATPIPQSRESGISVSREKVRPNEEGTTEKHE